MTTPWPQHALRCASSNELVAIYEPALTLVAAPLELTAEQAQALDAAATTVPCFDFVKEMTADAEGLEYALPWFERHAGGDVFLEATRPLVRLFGDLFEAERVGVHLTLTERPLSPRFHVDDAVCRLTVTLSGPGSEFLAEPDVRRKLLGAKESAVEREGATIHRLDPRDVALLKGEAWPKNQGRGVVHRSPHVEGRQLVMTVDLL